MDKLICEKYQELLAEEKRYKSLHSKVKDEKMKEMYSKKLLKVQEKLKGWFNK